jgi:dethiobiotin synthetase
MDQEYQEVNPIALQQAVAPHIAATNTGKRLSAERLAGFCRGVLMKRADLTIIEGAGGWRVPLNARETLAELPRLLEQPVILVVGMKLGCINHALLTAEAINRDGLKLAGWVANRIDPQMSAYEENLQTLISLINAPLIAEFPFMEDPTPRGLTHFVDLDQLLTLND